MSSVCEQSPTEPIELNLNLRIMLNPKGVNLQVLDYRKQNKTKQNKTKQKHTN